MQKILHIFFNDSIMSIAFVKYTEIKYSNFSILGGDKMEQELLKKILKEVEKIGELSNKVDRLEKKIDKIDELEVKVNKIDELSAKVDKIDVVPQGWGSPLEVFQHAYEHECKVSKMIDNLVSIASAEKDNATQDFLWGFVREQVEEEATAQGIVDKLKKAGDTGLLFIDAQLAKR